MKNNTIDLSLTPIQNDDVIEETLENELILYHPDQNELHNLNPIAAFIWRCSTGQRTLEEIRGELEEAFPEVKRQQIQEDLSQFCHRLATNGLIQLENITRE